ncbi:MAG: hypothetical protein FJ028_08290 [Chloroflexi bacterium]|nr:hypothetical protein [Chloroflexota bacterium]
MTRRTSSALRGFAGLLSLALLAAACAPAPRAGTLSDAQGGQELAHEAADILLEIAAYDYALAGTLSGLRAYVVDPARYAQVARASAARIQKFTGNALSAVLDSSGPVKERVVTLSDGLVELGRAAGTYADGADPAMFAKVVAGVARGWEDLRALHRVVRPSDDEVARTIARGATFTVEAVPFPVTVVSAGPFASAAEADGAAKRLGTVEHVARAAPFVVRVGTFTDRKAAASALAAAAAKGVTAIATEEDRFTFKRGIAVPEAELWREPERVFDVHAQARRVAVSVNAAFVATGSDDGTVAIFTGDGTLRSLPRFHAGVAHLAFSEDNRWLMGGGQTLGSFQLPQGMPIGQQARLPSPAQQLVYVPRAHYFAAISKGPTGEPSGGPGLVAGRAPDGAPLLSFPITTPASGGALAVTKAGELWIATNANGETDIEVLDLTRDRTMRGVLTVPGEVRALAIDPNGLLGAVITDRGVYRFGPKDVDPKGTLRRIADSVVDLGFGKDGTLYMLTKTRLSAHDLRGETLWSTPLIDARRLVLAKRPVVLDAADRLMVFGEKGATSDLGVSGSVLDVSASPDGARLAVLNDSRRAYVYRLP